MSTPTPNGQINSMQQYKPVVINEGDTEISESSRAQFQEIIKQGIILGASDIRLYSTTSQLGVVSFSIDGTWREYKTMRWEDFAKMIQITKNEIKAKPDEFVHPQSGRMTYIFDRDEPPRFKRGDIYDLRVEITPIVVDPTRRTDFNITMRILAPQSDLSKISDLDFLSKDEKIITDKLQKDKGMILCSGPTGEGKTTTLRCFLLQYNVKSKNILTLEDPVEFQLPGIQQSQVDYNAKPPYSFAEGLRSFMRSAPDIIMVGEIRDPETASISLQAVITGHLVFSTVHAADSVETVTRLLEMGRGSEFAVDPYLLTDALDIVIAQRLLKRVCSSCVTSTTYRLQDKAGQLKIQKDGVQSTIEQIENTIATIPLQVFIDDVAQHVLEPETYIKYKEDITKYQLYKKKLGIFKNKQKLGMQIREHEKITKEELLFIKDMEDNKKLRPIEKIRLNHGEGCSVCNNTGYKGRVGIYEVLKMTPELKSAIYERYVKGVNVDLHKVAKDGGLVELKDHGVIRVLQGLTGMDQVLEKTTK